MNKCLLTAWCCITLGWPAALAQISSETTDSLGTAEVTATRTLQGISSATPLQRIAQNDFRRRGITDTGDALRRLAGVNLRDYGGAGGLKTVSVRGLGATHTAVAYDGLCINDSRQGQIDLQRFNIDQLNSIELQTLDAGQLLCPVRNLAAALLNLQTQHTDTLQKGFHGKALLKQASFGTWNVLLNTNTRVAKRTFVSANANWFFAHNNYPFVVENGVATTRLHCTNSRMQAAGGEANVCHLLPEGKVEGKLFFQHNHRRLPGQVVLYVNENNERLTEQNAFGQLRWTQHFGRWEMFAAGKYNWQKSYYVDIKNQYPNGALRHSYRQGELYATAGVAYRLLPMLRAAYATDYAFATMQSNLKTDNDVSRHSWLQSLSVQWRTPQFNLTARGLLQLYRNQRDKQAAARNATRATASAAASYKIVQSPVNLYVRAGVKTGFRMPTFTEAYFYHLGETNLQPEHTRQFNLGSTLQAAPAHWWPMLAITADAYYNKVSNRIVSVPYNLFIWRTVNMGDVRSTGIDLVIESRWKPHTSHLLILSGNYSYQYAQDRTTPGSDTYGNQLAYTPLHHGAASLAWENPWLSVVAHATFASERWSTNEHLPTTQLPGYAEWGLGLYHTFCLKNLRIEGRADLINAFNHHYEIVRRYPMPGRAYRISCAFSF